MPPPAWLVDAVSSVVESGDERALYYETTDEYVVVVRGREFILHAARGYPGRPDPRGHVLVLTFSNDGQRRSVALPYVELDTSVYGAPEDLPLRSP